MLQKNSCKFLWERCEREARKVMFVECPAFRRAPRRPQSTNTAQQQRKPLQANGYGGPRVSKEDGSPSSLLRSSTRPPPCFIHPSFFVGHVSRSSMHFPGLCYKPSSAPILFIHLIWFSLFIWPPVSRVHPLHSSHPPPSIVPHLCWPSPAASPRSDFLHPLHPLYVQFAALRCRSCGALCSSAWITFIRSILIKISSRSTLRVPSTAPIGVVLINSVAL